MDIIYKNETKFDEDNNFSIDLTSNNNIQNMIFRERDEWLVSNIGLTIKKFKDSDEYTQLKKVSDLINKMKIEQKNNIRHGIKKNGKKWYKENKAVWNSIDYGKAQFKLQYQNENNASLYIKRREVPFSCKQELMLILERMNKIFTKNGDRINESRDWIHFSDKPTNGWNGSQNLGNYSGVYWSHVKNLSLEDTTVVKEEAYKKRVYTVYSKEKDFTGVEEKDPFLVHDDEKCQGITVHKTAGANYYISEDLYLNRDKNFLKNLANAKYVKRDADTEFPNHFPIGIQCNFYEKYVYEILNHNTTAGIQPKRRRFYSNYEKNKTEQ